MQIPRALSTDRSVNTSAVANTDDDAVDVRDRILAAAERDFSNKGYASACLREIAEAAGVTKPMIYYYFGSKEGLFTTLMTEIKSTLESELLAALEAGDSPRDQLVAIARTHIEWATKRALQWRLMVTSSLGPSHSPCPEGHSKPASHELLERVIRTAAGTGVIDDTDLEVTLFVARGVVHACYENALLGSALPACPDLPERIVNLLWGGIARNPSA